MLLLILGAQKLFNIKLMSKNHLMDFAYRNICFLKFLNNSLKVWVDIQNTNNSNMTLSKKEQFLQANKDNLAIYDNEKLIAGNFTLNALLGKDKKIEEWISENKININKIREVYEINVLSDKYVFPKFKEKLITLIKEKNLVLQFIFPQLIQNLFDCFELFKQIKVTIYEELKRESKNYTNLLTESCEKEKSLGETIKKDEKQIQRMQSLLKNERLEHDKKVAIMDDLIKKLKLELDLQNDIIKKNEELTKDKKQLLAFNSELSIKSEFYESHYLDIKAELKFLELRIEKLEKDNKFEKEKKLECEKELQKYKDELNKEKTKKEKIINNFQKFLEKNEKMANHKQEQINEEKEKLNQILMNED